MKKAIPLIITVFVFLSLVGCSRERLYRWIYPDMPISGLELPFAVHQAGAIVESDLRIIEYRSYDSELVFYYRDKKERELLLGRVVERNLSKYRQPKIRIPLLINIVPINDKAKKEVSTIIGVDFKKDVIIFGIDKKLEARETDSGGFTGQNKTRKRNEVMGWYSRYIACVNLKPGLYRITVKSIDNIPELAGIPSTFAISYNPKDAAN